MAAYNAKHSHAVVDTDIKHFVIDPITRAIKNETSKVTLIKNDHNSERFTFEMPKEIDGHDMRQCNLVEIHFINLSTQNRQQKSQGVYVVNDFNLESPDSDKCTFSWLISRNATEYAGTLNFAIRFACTQPSEEDKVETVYVWSTAIYTGILIVDSIDNSNAVLPAEEFSDIIATFDHRLQTWFDELQESFDQRFTKVETEVLAKEPVSIESIVASEPTIFEARTITPVTITKTDGTTEQFNIAAQNGSGILSLEVVDGELVMYSMGVDTERFEITDDGMLVANMN